jgi:hypothetical protein
VSWLAFRRDADEGHKTSLDLQIFNRPGDLFDLLLLALDA